jgi:hypothetical protein
VVTRYNKIKEPFQRFLRPANQLTASYSIASSLEKNSKPLKRFH